MSGGSEHFCLRWNDFESNISHAFREIRDEKDFFDVTLACEDEQVQAHKVILSACSPFFKKILRKNPHQHPLLFLKGVKYAEIVSILNFMYHGEVNVTQDELNAFLAVAEELKVKGLTQGEQVAPRREGREPPEPGPPPAKKVRAAETAVPAAALVKTEPLAGQDDSYSGNSSMVAQGSKQDMPLEAYEEPNYDYAGYDEEASGAQFDATNSLALRPDGNKETAQFVLSQLEEGLDATGKRHFSCKLCEFASERKEKVRQHVESWHGDEMGIRYRCDFCEKQYKCHSNLRSHVSASHKQSWSQ